MANKENKRRRLLEASRMYIAIPVILLAVMLAFSIVLVIAYAITNHIRYVIMLAVLFGIFMAAYVIVAVRIIKKIQEMYYKEIFGVTLTNIKKLANDDTNLVEYGGANSIEEIDELNKSLDVMKKKFQGAYLIVKEPDYSSLDLEYIDKEKKLITFDSFEKNLENIIFLSQSFRNVLIQVSYSMDQDFILEDKNRILNLYLDVFKDYENALFMFGKRYKALLIYLPVISSISRIKEQLETALPDSSLIVRDVKGLTQISPQFSVVMYPYSTVEYMLSDLRYARRQNKSLNIYIPNRIQVNEDQQLLMSSTMNFSYMSKMLTKISSLEYNSQDNEANEKSIVTLFNELTSFLHIDNAGIIVYDESQNKYISYIESEESTLFKHNQQVEDEFIQNLSEATDDDKSYYFYSRNQANISIGRKLDYYGIQSGYYQIVKDTNNRVIAFIYFFNRQGNMPLNSYLRESFFTICLRLAHYFEKKVILDYVDYRDAENEYILSISNKMMYKIDDDFNLVYLSDDMRKSTPEVKLGKPCYKEFYALDRPCHDCPCRSLKKKIATLKHKYKYEVSLSLNERKKRIRTLLLTNLGEDEIDTARDLFTSDYLTYTYLALYYALKNEYSISGRGYVLLLNIDNADKFIEEKGSEGFLFAVRCFIRNLKNKLKINDIYIYNPTTVAIHFPFFGHADILNKCETIYEISKENYFDESGESQLKITYLPIGYPRGFASADDFMKHMSDFYHSDKYERGKDFIYFCDYAISRSASKRDFILSVIESEFSGQSSTSVNLQPIVQVNNRHIYGAEILLRINDVHRNVFFNAEEISRIAEKENKTHLITESIINFVGKLYKEYGKGTFKINEFNRIAINIDQTYLRDPNLIKAVVKLCEENKIPNNFISFEIPEDMIPENMDKIKRFANELSNYHIFFSVDRFTGEYIGSEKLKDLGFNEVKIARNLITKIDRDPIQLKAVQDIVTNAKKVGISVACVGVENEAQLKILRELDSEMMAQGYYFYKPLTRSDLIAAIIS